MRPKNNKSKKNNGLLLGTMIIITILLVIIVFMAFKNQILTNLKETEFFDKVFGSTPPVVENHDIKVKEEDKTEEDDLVITLSGEDNTITIEPTAKDSIEIEDTLKEDLSDTKKDNTKEEIKEKEKGEKEVVTKMMNLELCFLQIDNDGNVMRKMVKRTVPKGDSPLTASINLLLKGPDPSNKAESKLTSLIPNGSKLISAKVKDGIAYLNFNDLFEFTTFGVEGSIHQLEQVVYTATTFSTVNKVQFLIEGKEREYLGSEGQWIGTPLSRGDF